MWTVVDVEGRRILLLICGYSASGFRKYVPMTNFYRVIVIVFDEDFGWPVFVQSKDELTEIIKSIMLMRRQI